MQDKSEFQSCEEELLQGIQPVTRWKSPGTDTPVDESIRAKLKRKTKSVAWIVSNCFPDSPRAEYVRELSKHLPVVQYGKCQGGLPCKAPAAEPVDDPANATDCMTEVKDDFR